MKAKHLFLFGLVFGFGGGQFARGESALFIGISYTFGGPEMVVTNHGGIPKIVEAIAVSEGKGLSTRMVTKSGKDLAYHLKQGQAEAAINEKKWDWVILQDFSSEATHVGNLDSFFQSSEAFCEMIARNSPATKVVLYETWARPAGSAFYTGTSTARTFIDAKQMNEEIRANYRQLAGKLRKMEPKSEIVIAPVGEAFEISAKEHPEIKLYNADEHHANVAGDYLASLVIYNSLYREGLKGAAEKFLGTEVDPDTAAKLQAVAEETKSRSEANGK